MSLIQRIRRALLSSLESTPSDELAHYLAVNDVPTAQLVRELERVDTYQREANAALADARAKREKQNADRILDGKPANLDVCDPLSQEFRVVFRAFEKIAESKFGVPPDLTTGKPKRGLMDELRARRTVLLSEIGKRYRAGDVPDEIGDTLATYREANVTLLDLRDRLRPLRKRRHVDPEKFGTEVDELEAAIRTKSAEVEEARQRLSALGWRVT